MKTILFLLVLLFTVIGASIYLGDSPLSVPLMSPNNTPSPSRATTAPESCSLRVIQDVIEGPYYKQNSPQRTNIREGANGSPFVLSGRVMDENCNPIAGAWIDFWQADGEGNYDNNGFRLRGHQFTDVSGNYKLETVIPGEYQNRTPHIHVKVRAYDTAPITTAQLYFPNSNRNQADPLYNSTTQIRTQSAQQNPTSGTYDFVIRTR